ncbi:putative membrane protein [Bacillus thuringiensis serovar morrisoni]|nr:putative membrane protein [Bacillus thuringiensis serovar morrisoni]
MKHNINLRYFIFSLICIGLFFLYLEVWSPQMNIPINTVSFHLLFTLLALTIGTFFVILVRFSKINNWKAMALLAFFIIFVFSTYFVCGI